MVEVDGRTLLSNGCRYYSDCFNCPFSDCQVSKAEALFRDIGKTEEEVQAWIKKHNAYSNKYLKRWKARKKEEKENARVRN